MTGRPKLGWLGVVAALLQSVYAVVAVATGLLGDLFLKPTAYGASPYTLPTLRQFMVFLGVAVLPFIGAVLLWLRKRQGWWICVIFDTVMFVGATSLLVALLRCPPYRAGDVGTLCVFCTGYFGTALVTLLLPRSRSAFPALPPNPLTQS